MKIPERDTPNKLQANLISSEERSEVVEANTNKQEEYNLNDAVTIEAKKLSQNSEADQNNLVEHHQQASLQPVSIVRVSPYPALRANLLPLSTYHVPSNLQTQFYSSNSHLELPLSNIGFYNPALPLFYQGTIGVSNNSLKHASTAAEDVKISTKSQITTNSQNDAKSDSIYSNVIKSRSFEPNKVEKTNKSATSKSKFESIITSERIKQKTASGELVNHAEKSESSVEQTTQDKASTTEFESTKINPSTSTTSTTKKCKCD